MNSLTVTKLLDLLSDFFNREMQTFYLLILTHSNPSHSFDHLNIDWYATQESILNKKALCEQFIQLLFERDKRKNSEILSQRIELIQKNLDMEDWELKFQKLEAKFNHFLRNSSFSCLFSRKKRKTGRKRPVSQMIGKHLKPKIKLSFTEEKSAKVKWQRTWRSICSRSRIIRKKAAFPKSGAQELPGFSLRSCRRTCTAANSISGNLGFSWIRTPSCSAT